MSEETGVVERVEGDWVWVQTQRKGACSSCGHRDHCQMIEGGDRMLVKARNDVHAKKGDEIELFISTGTKMKCIFLIYMVPVFGLMAGAFSARSLSALFGLNPKVGVALFSIAGLVIAYLLVRQYSKRMEIKDQLMPVAQRVVKRLGDQRFSRSSLDASIH
jgi:sigma-E factor negative regulatory protein RseC